MVNGTVEGSRERFTVRLEAFSDLVFGFSLSLLATRLDVPARVEDIFDSTRWLAIIGAFVLIILLTWRGVRRLPGFLLA